MKRPSATNAFFLACFALFSTPSHASSAPSPASTHSSPDVCVLNPTSRVSDACASYADLDALKARLHPYVRNLASNTDFFAYYRLNLYNKKCPFWSDENGLCGNIACAVTTLDDEADIPPIWRAEELGKLEGPKARHPGRKQQREMPRRPLEGMLGEAVGESCVVEYDDECDERDYCVPEDESASAKGDYVSLADNPERFTGYSGEAAHQVWEAIYRENCFSRPVQSEKSAAAVAMPGLSAGLVPAFGSQNQAQAAQDFRQVMKARDRSRTGGSIEDSLQPEDECLEKRVFYRVISGMHASISTHLCFDYLNQTTGEWGPNLQCYKDRLHAHPERIANLYFNYAFVLRAVGKLRDYVQRYTFCTGDVEQDGRTREMLRVLSAAIPEGPRIFDESVMFADQTADGLDLKEDFRQRFRNVSRMMDCVGCDKCRLWGKVQTNGFGTALKVLFEFNGDAEVDGKAGPLLRRTELVALVNTLDKISSALKALEVFRGMLEKEREGGDIRAEVDAAREREEVSTARVKEKINASAAHGEFPDFSELDELEDDGASDGESASPPPSVREVFAQEFAVVFRTFSWVLRTWAALPERMGRLVVGEGGRLWDFWLGKEIRARWWEFRAPSKEEL